MRTTRRYGVIKYRILFIFSERKNERHYHAKIEPGYVEIFDSNIYRGEILRAFY